MSFPFVGLGVSDILKASEFFLSKVEDWESNEKELNYHLFGFVVATSSIPDYLFHEYYIKYFKPSQITRDRFELLKMNEYIRYRDFRKECLNTGNQEALRFLNFWEPEKRKLRNDPKIDILYKLRNASVHHKLAIKPKFFKREIMLFGWEDEDENICIEDGLDFCKYCYYKMNEFIDHIRSNF